MTVVGGVDRTSEPDERQLRAIELSARDLGQMVRVNDWRGQTHDGRLDRFELSADERTRVVMWIATEEPTETGGTYWTSFSNDKYVNRDEIVTVRSCG